MSNRIRTAKAQSYTYASAYAIETTTHNHESTEHVFVAENGETERPCFALLYDSVEQAMAAVMRLKIQPAKIVYVNLSCNIQPV